MDGNRRTQCQGWLAVAGGTLVHLTLGTIYTFGNLTPYLTSYIRSRGDPATIRYAESVWIFSLAVVGQGTSMFIGGFIEKKIGPRFTALLGGWLMSIGVLVTYFAVHSFGLVLVTYGILFGLGIGFAYAPPLACGMRWMPERKGLVNGIIVAGFGGGAFIFDQVQTAFLNPSNLKPETPAVENPKEMYFSQGSILDKVPYCFLLIGAVYAVMQFCGAMLMTNPPADYQAGQDEEARLVPSSPRTSNKETVESVPPLTMLKSRAFWTLWGTFLLNGQATVLISTLFKTYGQTFIFDDQFLAIVGAFSAVFNAGGRIMWGHLADRWSYRSVMMIMCTSMVALMMTFIATPYGGKPMFFVWVCLIFLTFSGNFSLLPTATAKAFGPKYITINYGLIFTSQAITGVIGAMLASQLSDLIGWFGLFSVVAGCSFLGLILTYTFNVKTQDGKDI